MDAKSMKEKLEEAKRIYRLKEFRAFMRTLHGFTDEDFVGIVLSMVKKTTPLHDKERSQVMEAVSDTLAQNRMCLGSSCLFFRN